MTFFGKTESNMGPWMDDSHTKSCTPWIDISNEVWCSSNEDRMTKLRPREVEPPIYPDGAHSFSTSYSRVRFLDI